MTPGRMLCRLGRAACSASTCDLFLEPAIADLQHEVGASTRAGHTLRALATGYAAFWISFGWSLAYDARTGLEHDFRVRAGVVFLLAIGTAAALEALLMHASPVSRRYILTHVHGYVGFRAMSDTATLRLAVPVAMFPALFYAVRRTPHVGRATVIRAIVLGSLLAMIASGWLAPAIERGRARRQRDAFALATNGRYYQQPVEWQVDRYADAKSWPALIRGAVAPDAHRFAGYPTYVAPEDRGLRRRHWLEIYDRVWLTLVAVIAGFAGWWSARRHEWLVPGHAAAGSR